MSDGTKDLTPVVLIAISRPVFLWYTLTTLTDN